MGWWPWKRGAPLDAAGIEALASAIEGLGDEDRAWARAAPLREALPRPEAAAALARCLWRFGAAHGLPLARRLLAEHGDVPRVLADLGGATPSLVDIDDLNRAAPDDPWFGALVERLERAVDASRGATRATLLAGLATAARIWGRRGDGLAARAHAELCQVRPTSAGAHYDAGLFWKTRGRWADGQAANQRAIELGKTDAAARWNLGICATGAGDAAAALAAWRHVDPTIALGRFGMPEGSYPPARVRLAQRPLAQRGADDDAPGREENVWVERLSPCHGIVRVGVYFDELGVDYGDVVLFDGAPVGYVGRDPLFPHLATLARGGYRVWRFVGVQAERGQLGALSGTLPDDAVVYPQSENVRVLCPRCALGRGDDHGHHGDHDHDGDALRLVTGKVCAPPHVTPAALLAALDAAVAASPGAELLAPELCADAGDAARATGERARAAQLQDGPVGRAQA